VRAPALGLLLDALRGVTWPARERVHAGLPGAHRANQRGTSGEFTEYRAYRQGDDPRRLDWKLLARSDRAYLRVTDERAWVPTWLLVDASASLGFPTASDAQAQPWARDAAPSKWDIACALAVGLAATAHAGGDPVGLLVSARPEPQRLPPRTRRGTVHTIARTLAALSPRDDAPLAPLMARVPAGARVALITDALGNDAPLLAAIARARVAGSEVLVVHVVHPLELQPPAGDWLTQDPEHLSTTRVLTGARRLAYRAQFDAWRADFVRRVQATGARHVEVRCDEAPSSAVRRIVRGHDMTVGLAGATAGKLP
jgi:uncharacterized protein (DUF58 family)